MGCDIHGGIERRWHIDTTNGWRHYAILHPSRNYTIFGLLVDGHGRSSGEKGVAPERGIPTDLSWGLKDEWVDDPDVVDSPPCSDYHTASWVTLPEMEQVLERYRITGDRDEDYEAIAAAMRALLPLESRFVFWFDT